MNRKDEIEVIILFLENQVKTVANKYPDILSDTIVENGKLIEKYTKELKELK